MALNVLRLRRALSLSSYLLHHSLHQPKPVSSAFSHLVPTVTPAPSPGPFPSPSPIQITRPFTSTTTLLRKTFDPETDEIGPDTILFEGCDYNHWLITMDFPKDSNLTREQMIETYVNTAAQVFGRIIWWERIARNWICNSSLLSPFGFWIMNKCLMQSACPSKPFQNYGPPPPQQNYGPPPRQNFGPPPQQNYGPPPQQNYGPPPQQNYGPPPQPQNFGQPQQNYGPTQQSYRPPPQQSYVPPPQQSYGNSPNFSSQQSYGPPASGEKGGSKSPTNGAGHGERNTIPSYQGNFNQAEPGNHISQVQRDFQSPVPPEHRTFPQDADYGSSQHGSSGKVSGWQRDFSSMRNN
ncbi:hypothetical protein CDL12_13157 [Handroanthus impetiginosus]|uniref:MORF/ORRM1/DAG-like MORF domain-containing protein n=1 Tax=Handroanthus impetiginosus TaxID=429701 RepID=A0A2G9HA95_9LAMI|nr:hypothetical protein CDL12_13157 [Handroanthus impetiginosus]